MVSDNVLQLRQGLLEKFIFLFAVLSYIVLRRQMVDCPGIANSIGWQTVLELSPFLNIWSIQSHFCLLINTPMNTWPMRKCSLFVWIYHKSEYLDDMSHTTQAVMEDWRLQVTKTVTSKLFLLYSSIRINIRFLNDPAYWTFANAKVWFGFEFLLLCYIQR